MFYQTDEMSCNLISNPKEAPPPSYRPPGPWLFSIFNGSCYDSLGTCMPFDRAGECLVCEAGFYCPEEASTN